MGSINVKSLLFISSADKSYSRSFLFHCAKYWTNKGNSVLYITHEPVTSLPISIGTPKNDEDIQNFNLVKFMYLPTWKHLLKHCYSFIIQSKLPIVVIVQELEAYFTGDNQNYDLVSCICSSLLQAASVAAVKNTNTSYLVCGYNSKSALIPSTIVKNFFSDVWEIIVESEGQSKNVIKLCHRSEFLNRDGVKMFVFSENEEYIDFECAFETVLDGSQ